MRKHGRNSRDYLAYIPSFFGGNPPRRGRGVPKYCTYIPQPANVLEVPSNSVSRYILISNTRPAVFSSLSNWASASSWARNLEVPSNSVSRYILISNTRPAVFSSLSNWASASSWARNLEIYHQ